MLFRSFGSMNPTAVSEAAKNNYPMGRLVGNWWAGSDDDARPAGAGGKGYLSLDFNQVGQNFPVIQDILKHVVNAKKSQVASADKVGENFYNRGVLNSVYIAEGIRNAQRITGKKVITGEDMRRGLETLNITQARLKELGMEGFAAPVSVTCTDHNGHHSVYVAEWDGAKWTKKSDWLEPIKDKVLPLSATLGLHPSCTALHRLTKEGKVAIVQNVGYPNPNRSHFRSSEIWETASSSNEIGRAHV